MFVKNIRGEYTLCHIQFTISDLRKLEKKEKQASRQRRIAAVRMVMEGVTRPKKENCTLRNFLTFPIDR